METYPTKWLRDETGQKFIPITHINAVVGEEYITAVSTAIKQSSGHYRIDNPDLEYNEIANHMMAIRFDEIGDTTNPAYIQLNDGTEYPIYRADGLNTLVLTGLEESVCLFTFVDNKWQLVVVGTDSSGASGGGHTITDSEGNIMTQRIVLSFDGLDVRDSATNGATVVSNPSWGTVDYIGLEGEIAAGNWTELYSGSMNAPVDGTYRISTYLKLNNISNVGREVCVKVGEEEEWIYQYKRLAHTFTNIQTVEAGQSLVPYIYIDKLSSTDDIVIAECRICIEHINVQEL